MIDLYTSWSLLLHSHVKGLLLVAVCCLQSASGPPLCRGDEGARRSSAVVPAVCLLAVRLLYVCQGPRHSALCLTLPTALTLLTSLPELVLAPVQLAGSHVDA
ncbi:hypothetical protein CesoFtcFv8_003169 [Champsocephalus esox]|uniref:Secreted protein n=1 Tax=Champsocephalus esox TaxID=159716 RepID=A0AAN8CU57_9TELE|nr:hypothetical protein CesoFtcFv8_003169 [Champsocephalus esox]